MFKKGAMFGLDARIALTIFGALSVISGAALYSAIQQSKVVATVADLNEMAKAFEAYLLDTGTYSSNKVSGELSAHNLVENINNVDNWQGPYTSKAKGSHDSRLKGPAPIGDYEYTSSFYETGAWGGADSNLAGGPVVCDDGDACSVYVGLVATESQAMAEALDEYIDGSVDYKNGRFRIYTGTGSDYWLWYQVMPKK